MRLFCDCFILCLGRGLATGWSTLQGVLHSVKNDYETEQEARALNGLEEPLIVIRIWKWCTINPVIVRYIKGQGTPRKLATATQPQFPRTVAHFKQATGFQISGADWENLRLISCSHDLKWVCSSANFMHFSSAMWENHIDPVIIWWWLRRRKMRRRAKRKHWVHPFFRDNWNSGAHIVSKKFNQDPELFK
jgi:hypothetical protein